MNTFELRIWDDECEFVSFYTVAWEDEELSETDRFFTKFENDPVNSEAAGKLITLLPDVIGDEYGAIDDFFNRHENEAVGLPPRANRRVREIGLDYRHFPLRLYCLRLSEELVILFNGGPKTTNTVQEDGELKIKFHDANRFAVKINEALKEGMIEIEGRSLESFDGSDEILIY